VGFNLRDEEGRHHGMFKPRSLIVPHYEPMELMIEASPKKVFANAHMYHINSISVNSDDQTYLSADDLRVNLWHLEITDRSFSKLLFGITECYKANVWFSTYVKVCCMVHNPTSVPKKVRAWIDWIRFKQVAGIVLELLFYDACLPKWFFL